jgi:hypothetical protein
MLSHWEQVERARQAFNETQDRLVVEHMHAEERIRKDSQHETVARALASVLRQGLSATPDAFQGTRLAPSTVDEWARRWAEEIQ